MGTSNDVKEATSFKRASVSLSLSLCLSLGAILPPVFILVKYSYREIARKDG